MRIPKKWRDRQLLLNHFVGVVEGVVVSKYWQPSRKRWHYRATPEQDLLWEIKMVRHVKKACKAQEKANQEAV